MDRNDNPHGWHGRAASAIVVIASYMALAAIVLGVNPFAGQTIGPFDMLVAQPGWASTQSSPVAVRSRERTDVLDALVPRWMFARGELRAGRIPVWNPLPGGGEAGVQNLASAQLNPAFGLFTLVPSPALGFYAAVLFNLTMAACGAHFWLRRRLGLVGASFGGVTVMLCGFHTAWLFWPHIFTSIWICWLLWAVDGWWHEGSAQRFVAIVVTASLLILGGFPFVTELGLGAAVLLIIILAMCERDADGLSRLAGCVVSLGLAFGVCAIPLISIGQWLKNVDVTYRVGGSSLRFFPNADLLLPWVARDTPRVESTMYVGTVGLILALIGIAFAVRKLRVSPVAALFPLALLIVALALVFELVPHSLVGWVPGLGANPWSRSIIILDIAVAALAAFAIDAVVAMASARPAIIATGMALICIQTIDLANFFRIYNGPVPVAYFYPPTSLLTRVRADLRPFESVIADSNYLVSGTLGSYGIREWFGHGFKSRATKEVLSRVANRPFATPTASMLASSRLVLSSPVMRALGVRYILGDEALLSRTIVPIFSAGSERPMVALPALGTASWTQRVELSDTFRLTGVRLRLATYGASHLHGDVSMEIRSVAAAHALLGSSHVAATSIVDGAMARFVFSPAMVLQPGSYDLLLRYEGAKPGENITAWYNPGRGENCRLTVQPKMPDGCLIMQWHSDRDDGKDWRMIAEDRGLLLLENQATPRGPYFIPSLSAFPEASSAASVTTIRNGANDWILNYKGMTHGYVVIPMSSNNGWHFTLSGQPVIPVEYLGALPAIPVSGPGKIEAIYAPTSLRRGLLVMLAALLTCIVVVVRLARSSGRGASSSDRAS